MTPFKPLSVRNVAEDRFNIGQAFGTEPKRKDQGDQTYWKTS